MEPRIHVRATLRELAILRITARKHGLRVAELIHALIEEIRRPSEKAIKAEIEAIEKEARTR